MSQLVNDVEQVLNNKKAAKEAESERQKILAEMERISSEKNNLVKKTLAAQRAKFGAGGGGGGLSTDAVMARLEKESAEPFDEKIQSAKNALGKIKVPKSNLVKTWLNRLLS